MKGEGEVKDEEEVKGEEEVRLGETVTDPLTPEEVGVCFIRYFFSLIFVEKALFKISFRNSSVK